MEERNNAPLVSVIVVTYNSSRFILETLDSIKVQTYKNIELIVSDDCSIDNTVEICQKWLKENRDCFKRTEIITVDKNTGITGNVNRAFNAARGIWVKGIAGDDLLCDNAIEEYVKFVQSNKEIKCCFAKCIVFSGKIDDGDYYLEKLPPEKVFFGGSAQRQYHILSHIYVGSGPSFFCQLSLFHEVGGFDERFPLQEDHAFFIRITKSGNRFYLLDKYLVYYRDNPQSITHDGAKSKIFSNQQIRYIREYKYQYMTENLNWFWRMLMRYSLFVRNKIIDNGNTFKEPKCRLYHKIYMITDPFINYGRILKVADLF